MIKELIVVVLLASVCFALPTHYVKVGGNVLTKGKSAVRYLGSEMIYVKNPTKGSEVKVTFPEVIFLQIIIRFLSHYFLLLKFVWKKKFDQDPAQKNFIIHGFKSVQNSVESKVSIADGGFRENYISLAVTMPEHDAEAEISFFGDVVVRMHYFHKIISTFISKIFFLKDKKPSKSVLKAVKEYEQKQSQEYRENKLGVFESVQKEYSKMKMQAKNPEHQPEEESLTRRSLEEDEEITEEVSRCAIDRKNLC